MKKKQKLELCENCGYPCHPCLPCEEVIALNREDEDLPLLTNRHYNMAHAALGDTHRFKLPDGSECGWVEVQNAVKTLAFLYADKEFHEKYKPLMRGFTIPVLDHGFVRYIDHMGSDERICEGTKHGTTTQVNRQADAEGHQPAGLWAGWRGQDKPDSHAAESDRP